MRSRGRALSQQAVTEEFVKDELPDEYSEQDYGILGNNEEKSPYREAGSSMSAGLQSQRTILGKDVKTPLSVFRNMKGPKHPFVSIDDLLGIELKPIEWRNVPVPLVEFSEQVLVCMEEIKQQIHSNYNDASKMNRSIGLNDRNSRQEFTTIKKEVFDEL